MIFLDLYSLRNLNDISIIYDSILGLHLKIIQLEIKKTNERRELCKIIFSALPFLEDTHCDQSITVTFYLCVLTSHLKCC